MKKKRVSTRAVALAVAFILTFTPLAAYAGAGEPGREPPTQTGEGETEGSGSGGEYGETPGDDTPDNPGEEDSPGDSPDDGVGEPETPGDGNGEGPIEPETPRAGTVMPLGSPIMPANYTNTLTSVNNLQDEINKIITDSDREGTITLDITGGTAELANTVVPDPITVDTEIRLTSDTPLTLNIATGRHFRFDIGSGATLTLYLDKITLEGGANKGGILARGAGALSLQSGTVTNCRYSNGTNGGGVNAETGNVEISGSAQISGNVAGYGGGVFADTDNVEISGSAQISGNVATNGGGVFAVGHAEINGSAVIDRNTVRDSGGGVWVGGNVAIRGGAISGNTADTDGGGVNANNNMEISGSAKISDNTAGSDGGGVAAVGNGNVEIRGGEISDNTAGNDGGGVYAFNVNNVTVTGGSFKGNLAGNGGYWITPADETSAPYSGWSGYTSATQPFTYIANNFDIIYTPSGTPVHIAAFSMNDGSYGDFLRIEITSPGNPLVGFPADPVRDGFIFAGWNENADGSGGRITKDYGFTTTKRVYAQWRTPTSPPPPSGGAGSGYIRDDSDRDNSDPHAGGVLADRVFRVALQLNGGSFKGDTLIRVKEGNALVEPNDPVREGYVFTGWYTDEDCTKAYSFHRAVHGSFTLYAGWEPLPEPEVDPWQNPFRDVKENDWFYGDVAYVHENGLMSGISQGQFFPDTPVTRGMAVAILWRLSDSPGPVGTPAFADLYQDWYRDAVAWANDAGIAAGYSPVVFAPEDAITREQLAIMLYNYARYTGLDVNTHGNLSGYADSGDISGYVLEAMIWVNSKGYISGRSQRELAPKGITTRAEMAAIIHRFKADMTEE